MNRKRTLRIFLVCALICLNCGNCFAELSMENYNDHAYILADAEVLSQFDVFSDNFPDAYVEKTYVDLSSVELICRDGKIETTSSVKDIKEDISLINNDPQMLEEALEYIEDGKKLMGTFSATVYVSETYEKQENDEYVCVESKLLNKKEFEKEFSNGVVAESADYELIGDDYHEKYAMTLNLNVYTGGSTTERYLLAGTATWQEGSVYSQGRPSKGDDYIGFTWGGKFDFTKQGCIVSSNDNHVSLDCYPADSSPGAGYVWGFQEYKLSMIYGNIYAKNVSAAITLTKNKLTGGGNTTSVALKYIHTYESTKGSISVSASPGNIGGSITLSGVKDQWSLVATVSQLPY